jgi:hypothetical protein
MKPKPFPIQIRREIDVIGETIRKHFLRWGWKYLLMPSGQDEVTARLQAHFSTKYRDLLDAAYSWRSGSNLRNHEAADHLANEAEMLGIEPSMTPEEGERVVWDRHRDWYMSPILGPSIPFVTAEEHSALREAFEKLSSYHARLLSPEELARRSERIESDDQPDFVSTNPAETQSELGRSSNQQDSQAENASFVLALDEDGRSIRRIDLAGAKIWEGRWSNSSRSYSDRFNLLLTGCKRWLRGHQSIGGGYDPPPYLREQGVTFEVLPLSEVVAWFSKNYYPHPPELIQFFEEANTSPPSGSKEQRSDRTPTAELGLNPAMPQTLAAACKEEPSQPESEPVDGSRVPKELKGNRDSAPTKDTPEQKDQRVQDFLLTRPDATSEHVSKATGIPEQTVRRMPSWKARQVSKAKTENLQSARVKTRQLTSKMIELAPGEDPDPSQIVSELELLERSYLEQASKSEKAEYHKLERDERHSVLWLWKEQRHSLPN